MQRLKTECPEYYGFGHTNCNLSLQVEYPFLALPPNPIFHGVEERGSQPVTQKRFLDRRQFQKCAHKSTHELFVYPLRVSEYLVLQGPFLQTLQHDPLEGGFWINHPLPALHQLARPRGTLKSANATSQTERCIDLCHLLPFCSRVLIIDQGDGIDRTCLCAFSAA